MFCLYHSSGLMLSLIYGHNGQYSSTHNKITVCVFESFKESKIKMTPYQAQVEEACYLNFFKEHRDTEGCIPFMRQTLVTLKIGDLCLKVRCLQHWKVSVSFNLATSIECFYHLSRALAPKSVWKPASLHIPFRKALTALSHEAL